eukprot:COSAG04_NODE_7440_length_1128_cov_1.533528_2_plen_85_part_00
MSGCGGQVVVPEGGTVGEVVWFESGTVLPEDQPPDASKGIYRCASKTGDGCEGGPEGKLISVCPPRAPPKATKRDRRNRRPHDS